MRSKGIELPTNTLIILIIAVIVLLAVVALFMSGILSWKSINVSRAIAQGCTKYVNLGCKQDRSLIRSIDTDVDIDGDGETDNFGKVLDEGMGSWDVDDVQSRCACSPVV